MRIQDVNLGGGLHRLVAEATCYGENVQCVPTHVMDDIMRDVVRKSHGVRPTCGCGAHTQPRDAYGRFLPTRPTCGCAPQPIVTRGEGINIKVDKSQRAMYGGFDAEYGYQKDMAAYRNLERAAKACKWPNVSDLPNYRVVGGAPCAPRAIATPRVACAPCAPSNTKIDRVVNLLETLLCEVRSGL